ncbi:cytochrome bd-I oxidase subunit CydX [Candidatus Sarmatiella mevalonica]|nr:cytochrome bd-I oxidase subunit CydX [Candidatus Sarmatiella mevalonica]
MWYFTWILGLGIACLFTIVHALALNYDRPTNSSSSNQTT